MKRNINIDSKHKRKRDAQEERHAQSTGVGF